METSSGVVLEMLSDGPPLGVEIKISPILAEAIEDFFEQRLPDLSSEDRVDLARSLANRLQADIIEGAAAALVPWADAVLDHAMDLARGKVGANVTP